MPSYDALLVLSFGGPEKHEDVIPFLENVLRGRNVPRERMLEVAEHYYHFDGRSPINDQNRALIEALRAVVKLPVYWGNRNWHPMLADTLRQMQADGVKRAVAFATSAFGSYSGCRQYGEDIARARAAVGEGAPEIVKIRPFSAHPKFIEAMTDRVQTALNELPEGRLLFTAHSIPESMTGAERYRMQLLASARLVAHRIGTTNWALVFQSRSGRPEDPWLGPDVCEYLRAERTAGLESAVLCPIGFICDHIEVLFDLDVEAAETARAIGLPLARAATVNDDPGFLDMMAGVVTHTWTRYERGVPLPIAHL